MKEVKITSVRTLGSEIRKSRKEQKLSQSELASLSDTGIRFISELENGKDNIQFGKLLNVIKALGLNLTLINKWSD